MLHRDSLCLHLLLLLSMMRSLSLRECYGLLLTTRLLVLQLLLLLLLGEKMRGKVHKALAHLTSS